MNADELLSPYSLVPWEMVLMEDYELTVLMIQ